MLDPEPRSGDKLISSLLVAGAIGVGFCIGAVGIGGILLIPLLTLSAQMSIHEASATALFTFLFTGICGTWLFHRRGSIDWRSSLPVCAGAVVFSYVGAQVNAAVGAPALALVIAVVTICMGVYTLLATPHRIASTIGSTPARSPAVLLGIGALAGFGSGLSGAGGPLFSVPLMLLFGFAPLSAIGTGQVLQIVAAFFGSIANLQHGSINFSVAGWLTVCELVGLYVGVYASHCIPTKYLRAMVALLCLAVGTWMLFRVHVVK